ncbi:hypothetical protein [Dyadobacter sp. 676]|uniref:Outer membrane protein beta-barrel domain-containing protein n=1 Tax=Dyadobacter sp. 676 TaxID=3088362 RepID=A0AAU8FQU9_9BACT
MIRSFAALLLVLGMVSQSAIAQEAPITEWRKDREEAFDHSGKTVEREKEADVPVLPRWTFGLNGGYAYRLFRAGRITSHDEQEYIKDLKSGIAFGGDIAWFPWKHVGFGLRYEMYKGDARMDSSQTEKVTIQHLSGGVIHRSFLKNGRTAILTSLLLGYQPYENKSTVGTQALTFSGKTMNWGVSVGIEQPVSPKFALNLTGTAMMGAIYRLQRKTEFSTETLHLSKDDSVDLSRFSITLGFRFM